MKIIKKVLTDPAVYWPPAGATAAGVPAYGPPEPLMVRWVEKSDQVIGPDGTTKHVSNNVMTSIDTEPGGMLVRMGFDAVDPELAPTAYGALEIQATAKTPTVKGTKHVRRAFL